MDKDTISHPRSGLILHANDNYTVTPIKKRMPLTNSVFRWVLTVSICLIIWAVVSPIFYETVVMGNGPFVLLIGVCVLIPLLLAMVSSTRKIIVQTREQYFPSVSTADLPASDSLVRAAVEPTKVSAGMLLRAATESQEQHADLLVQAVNGQE